MFYIALSQAQPLVQGEFFEGKYPVFDAGFMQSRHVASVTLKLKQKPSSGIISPTGITVIYFFDVLGRLSTWHKISTSAHGKTDTLTTKYFYTGTSLQAISTRAGKYLKTIIIEQINDSLHLETTRVKRGDLNWQEITKEQVVTSRQGAHTITKYRGGIGEKPYETIILELSEKGLITKETRYGVRIQSIETRIYETSRLATIHIKEFMPFKERHLTFPSGNEEDAAGAWCEETNCRRWSWVDFSNGLPKAWLFFDTSTQDLEIWEFEYRFF